jgi:hypothetical protein
MSTWQQIGSTGENTYTEACLSVAELDERSVHRGVNEHIAMIERSETTFVEHQCDVHTSGNLDCFVAFASQVHE